MNDTNPHEMSIAELMEVNIHDHISHLSPRQIKEAGIDRLLDELSLERDGYTCAGITANIMVAINEAK